MSVGDPSAAVPVVVLDSVTGAAVGVGVDGGCTACCSIRDVAVGTVNILSITEDCSSSRRHRQRLKRLHITDLNGAGAVLWKVYKRLFKHGNEIVEYLRLRRWRRQSPGAGRHSLTLTSRELLLLAQSTTIVMCVREEECMNFLLGRRDTGIKGGGGGGGGST